MVLDFFFLLALLAWLLPLYLEGALTPVSLVTALVVAALGLSVLRSFTRAAFGIVRPLLAVLLLFIAMGWGALRELVALLLPLGLLLVALQVMFRPFRRREPGG